MTVTSEEKRGAKTKNISTQTDTLDQAKVPTILIEKTKDLKQTDTLLPSDGPHKRYKSDPFPSSLSFPGED